jgi:hypothetical protein
VIELLIQAERALTLGLLDEAERLYRQTIAADPRNSIAVVGLARVTLERGDEAGALWHARRALVIDPDNPAARRLVDRLVEVITTRSDVAGEAPNARDSGGSPVAPASAGPQPHVVPRSPAVSEPPTAPTPAERRSLIRRLLRRG